MKNITTPEMELALVRYLNPRQKLIVPNVSWGMFMHECDLLVITEAGYAWEIEIKISLQDLKRDLEKRHKHENYRIKYLYFAIPYYLKDYIEYIPKRAGIIVVDEFKRCEKIRKPEAIRNPYKFKDKDKYKVARLGALRIWGLKQKLLKK